MVRKFVIKLDKVSKTYPDGTVAVKSLTLEAPSGELTVLVGPSGCGKTTSLRMINRLIDPTGGAVFLDGVDTKTLNTVQLRRRIGYVIQNAGLFPHRTIIDNVTALPRLMGADRKKSRTHAMELLERVGLDAGLADRYPWQLSGGQQQRVGVARALATDPPFLLMDEPFSAVDPVVRAQLQDEFLRLQADIGKTIVMVTHDIEEALKLGNQVAVLREGGEVAQIATPIRLLNHPTDQFVADFVGSTRGYRALGFVLADRDLPMTDEIVVRIGELMPNDAPDWVVAVNSAAEPIGWVRSKDVGTGFVSDLHVNLSGTTARTDGSLRAILDAALSSPAGRGIICDTDGRLMGGARTSDVVDAIERARREVA